jgi:hypothetical protein
VRVNRADAHNHACQLESDGSGCPSGEGRVRTHSAEHCLLGMELWTALTIARTAQKPHGSF